MKFFILCLVLSAFSVVGQVAQTSKTIDSVILAGNSVSKDIDVHACVPAALILPTNMNPAANFTLQSSLDGSTFTNVYDRFNNEVTIQTGTGTARTIILNAGDMWFGRHWRIRMGTAAAATNTVANFNFSVVCR